MDDVQFRCFLDLMMVSDPWPLGGGSPTDTHYSHTALEHLANVESAKRGFSSWFDAYHKFMVVKAQG